MDDVLDCFCPLLLHRNYCRYATGILVTNSHFLRKDFFRFPFYFQLKIVFIVWLLSPWTKGASILYRKWIHPTLSKHEGNIDAMLEQAKSESYNQVSMGISLAAPIWR